MSNKALHWIGVKRPTPPSELKRLKKDLSKVLKRVNSCLCSNPSLLGF